MIFGDAAICMSVLNETGVINRSGALVDIKSGIVAVASGLSIEFVREHYFGVYEKAVPLGHATASHPPDISASTTIPDPIRLPE